MYQVIRVLSNGIELVEEDSIPTYAEAESLIKYLNDIKDGNYYISRDFIEED